jgi:hypothetical protein
MLSMPILEVAISLSFLFCLLSLFATVVQELLASTFRLRGKMLYEGVRHLLDDANTSTWVKTFYAHPLVRYMAKQTGKRGFTPRPSYLSKATFITAFRELIREKALAAGVDPDSNAKALWQFILTEGASSLPESTRKVLQAFWREAAGDLEAFEKRVGSWFDDTMERVSGWYKRQAQHIALALGLTIALIMNVDTLAIAKKLANDTQARQAITLQAVQFANDSAAFAPLDSIPYPNVALDSGTAANNWDVWAKRTDSLVQSGKKVGVQLDAAKSSLGLGWRRDPVCDDAGVTYPLCLLMSNLRSEFCIGRPGVCQAPSLGAFTFFLIFKILGYAATACAIALGAPFWFDLLSKLVKLRGSGQRPQGETK